MSLKLPLAPGAYDKGDQAQMRGAVERADLQNRKRQEDLVLGPGQRLVFYDGHGAEQHFTGAVLGGLVRSDIAAQGLSPAEQANARANIATGSGAGTPGGSGGQVQFNNGGGFGGFTMGGDASLNVLTGALTLAAVNADAGLFGDAAHVGQVSVNAKGLVTAASSVPIAFPVTAFNARTGAITLTSSDVTAALGYAPLSAASPAYVRNLGGAPSVQEGTHASRPAAGASGALYLETDTKSLWRDNGTGWDGVGGSAPGGSSGQLQFNNSGVFGGVALGQGLSTAGGVLALTGTVGTSIPLVTGSEPPGLVSDGAGHLLTVAYHP